jgi:hypothetical protein
MPKQNPYLIKENYKQVEEVSYLEEKEIITPEEQAKIVDKLVKNEIPSYEEFMKTYQEEEGVIDSYYYEVDSHGDIRVVKCYGPGNSQSSESAGEAVFKKVASVALAASYFTPAVVVTGPLTAGGIAGSMVAGGIGLATGDEDAKKVGSFLGEITVGAAVDGLSAGTLNSGAPVIAKVVKKGCEAASFISDAKDMAEGTYIPMSGPRENGEVLKLVSKYGI